MCQSALTGVNAQVGSRACARLAATMSADRLLPLADLPAERLRALRGVLTI